MGFFICIRNWKCLVINLWLLGRSWLTTGGKNWEWYLILETGEGWEIRINFPLRFLAEASSAVATSQLPAASSAADAGMWGRQMLSVGWLCPNKGFQ